MEITKNAPKIRFPGFTDDWEQRKFGDITELKSASRVHREEWTSEGVPFYRSSDVMSAINGTQNEKAFISEKLYEKLSSVSGKLEEGDVLVTGGGSVGNPYIVPDNKPLYTKDADLLWIKNQGRFDAYFIYEFFFSPTFRAYLGSVSHVGTIAHYTITQLSETPIALPSLDEQKCIGNYFRRLDNFITLHQRKLDTIKQYKQGLLQKMFPKEGERVPEIRFPGFTDDWEQRKFGELYKKSSEKNDGSIGMDKNITVATMQYKEDVKVSTDEYLKTYFTFKLGDIAFEGHQSKDFRFGRFVENDIGDGIVSHIFAVFRPIVDYDLLFWKYAINNERLMQKVLSRSTKASTMMHDLVTDDFLAEKFLVPTLEEQRMIGSFLASIDKAITLHQRKLDQMKQYKQGLLQQMFV